MNKPNIFAISGYINSGKDTVAQIINMLMYLKENKIPVSEASIKYQWYTGQQWKSNPYFEIKKFAAKLKQIASILTGIPVEKFEDQEFKKMFLEEQWDYYIGKPNGLNKTISVPEYNKLSENQKTWFLHVRMTVRELLQKLGTEAMRDGLHTNVWVNALFADYKPVFPINKTITVGEEYKYLPNWIISDLRFPNEYDTVKERGGICVRIDRNGEWVESKIVDLSKRTRILEVKERHISETALDNHDFDYVIDNSGSIEDLVKEVENMLKHYEII